MAFLRANYLPFLPRGFARVSSTGAPGVGHGWWKNCGGTGPRRWGPHAPLSSCGIPSRCRCWGTGRTRTAVISRRLQITACVPVATGSTLATNGFCCVCGTVYRWSMTWCQPPPAAVAVPQADAQASGRDVSLAGCVAKVRPIAKKTEAAREGLMCLPQAGCTGICPFGRTCKWERQAEHDLLPSWPCHHRGTLACRQARAIATFCSRCPRG